MRKFNAHLESVTPYGQGRYHDTPKLPRELHDAYEERTYLHKLHVSLNEIYIPPMAIKKCLEETAQYIKMPIPGRGKETYTKNIRQAVLINEPCMLGIAPAEVRLQKVFTLSQPAKPQGGRVWKYFPVIDQWAGVITILSLDEIVTEYVMRRHLEMGGLITGIGVWRPNRGGSWGKFRLTSLTEEEIVL